MLLDVPGVTTAMAPNLAQGAVGVVTASSKGKYYIQCKRLKIGNISPSVLLALRAQKANEA